MKKSKPCVSILELEKNIFSVEYVQVGLKTMVCCLTLKSGFEVVGSSSVLRYENFDNELAKEISYKEALNKLISMDAYRILENENDIGRGSEVCHNSVNTNDVDDFDEVDVDGDDDDDDGDDEFAFDYRRCECFECDNEEVECNNGCPATECPQNEEYDFKGYEDDGTENYDGTCSKGQNCERNQKEKTYVLTKKGEFILELLHDGFSYNKVMEIADKIFDS